MVTGMESSVVTQPAAPVSLPAAADAPRVPGGRLYFEQGRLVLFGRPYLSWLGIGLVLAVGAVAAYGSSGEPIFLKTGAPLAVGTCLIPLVARYAKGQLEDWASRLGRFVDADPGEVRAVFDATLAHAYRRPPCEVAGTLVVAIALPAFILGGFFQGLAPGERFVLGMQIAIAAFASGVGLYSMAVLSRIVARVGAFPVKVESHPYGVLSTGSMLVRCYLVAGAIWFVISLSASWDLGRGWITLATIAVPALFGIVGSFVAAQLPLHRRMLEFKRERVEALTRELHALLPGSAELLSEDRQRSIRFLEERIDATVRLPAWPFGLRGVLGVLGSLVMSVLPAIVQVVLGLVGRS